MSDNDACVEQPNSSAAWQRSSAWALLPLLVKSAWELFGLILGGAVLSSREKYAEWMPYALAALALLVIGRALIGWRFTRFRVTVQGIELKQGLLHKRQLLLPQARVQELQVRQPFYFRPLQLYAASIDSAGSKQQEFALTGLSAAQLLMLQGQSRVAADSVSAPFWRIWLATLYNAYLWLPLAALVGASQQFSEARLVQSMYDQLQQALRQYDLQHSVALQLISGAALLLLVAAVLALMALIWLYPQHFVRDTSQLQLTQGTVLKKSLRISTQRVQMITLNQPWLARLFGHYSMIFHGFANQQQSSKFALLGQTTADLDEQLHAQQWLSLSTLREIPAQNGGWQRFVTAYFQRAALWRSLSLVALSFLLWQSNIPPLWLKVVVPLLLMLWWFGDLWLTYRCHGYLVRDDVLYLWLGGISQRWQILPLRQVQQVRCQQSAFFQQQQMVQVYLQTANGSVMLAAIPQAQAQQLYAQVLALQYPDSPCHP